MHQEAARLPGDEEGEERREDAKDLHHLGRAEAGAAAEAQGSQPGVQQEGPPQDTDAAAEAVGHADPQRDKSPQTDGCLQQQGSPAKLHAL